MSLINKLKQLFTQISNNRLCRKIDDVPFMTEGILAIIIFVYVFGIVTNSTDAIINYGAMYRPLVNLVNGGDSSHQYLFIYHFYIF